MPIAQPAPELLVTLPLHDPPQVVAMGRALHGRGQAGSMVERYLLPHLWCVHLYFYRATVHIGAHAFEVHPGDASLVAPNTPLEYHFQGLSPHLFAHFRVGSNHADGSNLEQGLIRVVQPLHDQFERVCAEMEKALEFWGAGHSRRAEARLWEVLWQLAEADGSESLSSREQARHPAFESARARIEERLHRSFSIADIAREVGVSPGHLTRLFHAEAGQTVAAFVARRRAQRAQHLLVHSTLPFKVVATQSGYADPHGLNKAMRAHFGVSPRRIRSGALSETVTPPT